jgi:hypothetical protein
MAGLKPPPFQFRGENCGLNEPEQKYSAEAAWVWAGRL